MPPPALAPAHMQEPALFDHQQQGFGLSTLKKLPEVIPGHARLVDSNCIEFNACPDCNFKWCPKANDPAGKCELRRLRRRASRTCSGDREEVHVQGEGDPEAQGTRNDPRRVLVDEEREHSRDAI